MVWDKRRPWWRFFVILPESERELEMVFKLNLLFIACLAGAAGFFVTLMFFASNTLDVIRYGFLFVAMILLVVPLIPDSLLSSIEYHKRKFRR